jgi:hypothetical protein
MNRVFSSVALKMAFVLSFLSVKIFAIAAEAIENDTSNPTGETRGQEKAYATAAGETLLSNAFVFSIDRFIGNAEFARVSLESMERNLSARWQWDQSDFATNQIMHPYHGSSYFAAGRSNGLSFYESTLLAAGGSASWELFGERCLPAMNDLIETTLGGASFGEMIHRLYIGTAGTGSPLSFLVSPVDAINDAVNRRTPKRPTGAIKSLSVSSGMGYAGSTRYQDGVECRGDRIRTPTIDCGFNCVYGDPFDQSTVTPFDQFELSLSGSGGYPWYDIAVLSDGYLLAFSPESSVTHRATAGLTLHYDILWTRNIQFAANALDLTLKRWSKISSDTICEERLHAGAIVLGVANFYSPEPDGATYLKYALHDYGIGAEAKAGISFASARHGTVLNLNARLYGMKILPGTVEDSEGLVVLQQYSAEFLFPVGEKLSFLVGESYVQEDGKYLYVPNVRKMASKMTLGVVMDLRRAD